MFLAANDGILPPVTWPEAQRHPRLPVSNVSWREAQLYAEWVGKRLPSYAEWQWAACGKESRIYPWPDPVPGTLLGNCRFGPGLIGLSSERDPVYFQPS